MRRSYARSATASGAAVEPATDLPAQGVGERTAYDEPSARPVLVDSPGDDARGAHLAGERNSLRRNVISASAKAEAAVSAASWVSR